MDMTQLLELGAKAFLNNGQSGDNTGIDSNMVANAISGLTGGNGFDLNEVLSNLQGGDLASLAQSWLGNGNNSAISANQITDLFGSDKMANFASQLGVSEQQAAAGLSDSIPQMIDNASDNGSILDSLGGIEGAMNLANSFFGK